VARWAESQCFSGLSRVRGLVWFATLPDDIRESMTSAISDLRTSFRAEPKEDCQMKPTQLRLGMIGVCLAIGNPSDRLEKRRCFPCPFSPWQADYRLSAIYQPEAPARRNFINVFDAKSLAHAF